MSKKALIAGFVSLVVLLVVALPVSAATVVFTGSLNPGQQINYEVEISAGSPVTATLVCANGSLDPIFDVHGPDGNHVAGDDDSFTPCNAFASSVVVFTAPLSGTYTFHLRSFSAAQRGPFVFTVTIGLGDGPFVPGDDRINPDPAAPVSIYCRTDGIHVFSIDRRGQGREIFVATNSEINAVGIPPVNTLIDSAAGVGLYRLTSGEFQVNSSRIDSTQPKVRAQEAGQTIIHTVQRGENLFRIALRYNTTIAAIAQLNGIVDVTRIYAGQQLTIVVGSRGTAGTTPVTAPGTTIVNQPSSVGIGAGYVFIFGGC
jgi:hypothetical protein